jgi:hypothetical protein
MTSINALGIRIAIIACISVTVLFGITKIFETAFSHTPIQQPSPTTQATTLPITNPAPLQSLSPETLHQLANLAKQDSTKIGPETKKYVSSLPADAEQTKVLNPTTINSYVDTNKGQLLASLPSGLLKTSSSAGKTAIKTYLDAVSYTQNTKLQNITGDSIVTAFQKQESGEDVNALTPVLASVQSNYDILKAITVPKEAADIQTKILQATYALIINIQRVQTFKTDQINGLIGLKNISDLDPVFLDISTQITALEKKYNLQ